VSLDALESANLISVNRDDTAIHHSSFIIHHSLDTHPHIRQYFAKQLREKDPDAWRRAHRRLYEHLSATTEEGDQPTLEDLQPLYQALTHGCEAHIYQEAVDDLYRGRILRENEYYPIRKLGAFGSDLGAVACFFKRPWSRIAPGIRTSEQAW